MANWKSLLAVVAVSHFAFNPIYGEAEGSSSEKSFFDVKDVLVRSGDIGAYATPTIVVSKSGAVLLFVDQRMGSSADQGNIHNAVVVRSLDNGKTWLNMQTLVSGNGRISFTPTCAIADVITGKIFVFIGSNPLKDVKGRPVEEPWAVEHPDEMLQLGFGVSVMESSDDGATWSESKDITATLQIQPDLMPHGIQSGGAGFQLKYGAHIGRLVVPSRIWTCKKWDMVCGSGGLFYSDDHGKTWKPGGAGQPYGNECVAVELSDGTIYLNSRNYNPKTRGFRCYDISRDGGDSFTESGHDSTLIEPICHAGMVRYSSPREGNVILFCNPADNTPRPNGKLGRRHRLTVYASFDDCKTWPVSKVIEPGKAGYSSLAVCSDGTILCAYERGKKGSRENTAVARFNMAWLRLPQAASGDKTHSPELSNKR